MRRITANTHFGDVLRASGITQTDLAKDIGISRPALTLLVRHNQWPKLKKRVALVEAIKQSLTKRGVAGKEISKVFEMIETGDENLPPTNFHFQLLRRGVAMIPNYVLEKIGLNKDPFTNELAGIEDVFDSKQHLFVLSKMVDAARNQKFLGVYGAVGSGKTIIKNLLIEKLKAEKNFIVSEPQMIERSKCNPGAICDAMIEDFNYSFRGISTKGKMRSPRSLEAKNRLVHAILTNHARNGRRAVLLIDEAHDLPLETIKALKRFHEHQDGFKKLLGIIIIGQEELFQSLNKDYRVREVTARIDLVEMKAIGNVVDQYLKFKIEKAGGQIENIFSAQALEDISARLHSPSPLLINVLASHAILRAYQADSLPVNSEAVELAYKYMAA